MLYHYVLYLQRIRFFLQGFGGVAQKSSAVGGAAGGGGALWFSSVVMSGEFLLACLGS